ncbi:MAG: helix-turn-helix domain-containing protein [Terriglobia bacterium]
MRFASKMRWQNTHAIIAPQIRADGVHVWPFDRSLPIAVTFQVFGEGQPVRMNRHDYFEIAYVLNGEVHCQVGDRALRLREGELIVIGSSLYHRMWRETRAHPRLATLFFMPEIICEAGTNGEQAEFLLPFYLQGAKFPHIVPARTGIPAEVFKLIQRIHATLPAQTTRARLSVRTYLKMVLILLVNYYSPYLGPRQVGDRKQEATRRIAPLFEFLELHYNEMLSVEDAAALLEISKPHFMRLFKQVTGQSFISYLNHFRIAKAQAILATSDKPIAQLCQEVGFCDQSYFGSVFRKTVHVTPLEYRRRFGSATTDTHLQRTVPLPAGAAALVKN